MHDLNALSLPELFVALTADGSLRRLLELARDEDLGVGGTLGDVTSQLGDQSPIEARFVSRSEGVLAGAACIRHVMSMFAPDYGVFSPEYGVDVHIPDGSRLSAGSVIATVRGEKRHVLAAERTMLNLIGRLSGVATRTAAFVARLDGLPTRLLDTRKTTPGLRSLEKYAVRCGGGFCHRLGLYDAVLIKDNHIAAASSPDDLDELVVLVNVMTHAAKMNARDAGRELRFVELEVDRLDQLDAILKDGGCGLDIILLDNMDVPTLRAAVAMRDASGVKLLLEASGGVRLETVRGIAETGVDRISVGGLTHQAVSLDVGLDIG